MAKVLLLSGLLAAGMLAGCSKGGSGPKGAEATLPELSRALQSWVMARGSYPANLSELTNFPTLHGKRLPTPPPGKRLTADPATGQVVFADQ